MLGSKGILTPLIPDCSVLRTLTIRKNREIRMEQYKVILVDDEVEVIDDMKMKIRWNDLGIDVV